MTCMRRCYNPVKWLTQPKGTSMQVSVMRVTVDRGRCIGTGCCVANAPSVFKLDDEKISTVIDPNGLTMDQAALYAVAKDCPTAAIILLDQRGQPIYP
jgi:ferredoxin